MCYFFNLPKLLCPQLLNIVIESFQNFANVTGPSLFALFFYYDFVYVYFDKV